MEYSGYHYLVREPLTKHFAKRPPDPQFRSAHPSLYIRELILPVVYTISFLWGRVLDRKVYICE